MTFLQILEMEMKMEMNTIKTFLGCAEAYFYKVECGYYGVFRDQEIAVYRNTNLRNLNRIRGD